MARQHEELSVPMDEEETSVVSPIPSSSSTIDIADMSGYTEGEWSIRSPSPQPSTSATSSLGRMAVSPSLSNPARGLFSPPPLMPISRPAVARRNIARRGAARPSGTGQEVANVRSSWPPSRGVMPGGRGRFDDRRRRGTHFDTLHRLRGTLDRMERNWRHYRWLLEILERHCNRFPEHAYWTPRSEVRQQLEIQYLGPPHKNS